MPDFTPTEAQLRALDLSLNTSVTAGAGSGKTSVLVSRYIATLAQRPDIGVRNVLAITFTDKAAAEMKHRVRQEVEKRIARDEDAPRWRDVLETLDQAAISTIHSFCMSILREHPVEAGVDPLFEILDETQSSRLRREAVDEALQLEGDDANALQEPLRAMIRAWGRGRTANIIISLFSRTEGDAEQWAIFYRDSSAEEIRRHMDEQVKAIWMTKAQALFTSEMVGRLDALQCPKAGVKIEQTRQSVLAVMRMGVSARNNYQALADLVPELCGFDLRFGNSTWDGFAECKELLKQIRTAATELQALKIGELDWNAVPLLKAISLFFLRALDIYAEGKGFGRRLDFDDLQRRALELLHANRGAIRNDIYRRFAAVLVDEFQDTNRMQWEIVRHVVEPPDAPAHAPLPPGRLFIVGDPKQSIYRFREAEIRVFGEVKDGFIDKAGGVEMDDNFRAAQRPIDFVNRLMNGWMGAMDAPFDPAYRDLLCRRSSPVQGSVSLLLPVTPAKAGDPPDDDNAQADAPPPQEAELVARQILSFVQQGVDVWDKDRRQVRPARFGDAAILLRSRTRQSTFEDALRRAGIPFTVLGGLGFFERQEVLDLLNLARFLLNQGDDIALAAVLRSPLLGVSDDALYRATQAKGERLWDRFQAPGDAETDGDAPSVHRARLLLPQWLKWSRRMPVAELLEHVLGQSGMWGAVAGGERGEQCMANLEKMVGMARRSPDLAGFVAELEDMVAGSVREGEAQIEPEESDTVKLLTIHAAKGLEFPIVCVVDTAFRPNRWAGDLQFHREFGMGVKSRGSGPDAEKLQDTVMRKLINERIAKEEEAESVRLLYVALTRCRDHLVVSGTPPGDAGTWLAKICERLGIQQDHPEDVSLAAVHTDGSRIPVQPQQPAAGLDALLDRYRAASKLIGSQSGDQAEALAGLQPVEGGQAVARFSPTALERYLHCPYSYFLTEVLGVPHTGALEDEMPQPALVFTEPGPADSPQSSYLKLGTIAHRYFEAMTSVRPVDEREAIMRLVGESEISDPAECERIARLVANMAAAFRASAFGQAVLSAPESHTEVPFAVPVGRGTIYGKIDRLYRDAEGWKILDYKTDHVSQAELAERCERYKPQLFAYAIAMGKLLGCEPPEAWLYFARPAQAVPLRFGPGEAEAFEARLAQAIDLILKKEFGRVAECPENCPLRPAGFCEIAHAGGPA